MDPSRTSNIQQHLPPLRLASRARQEYAGACPFCGGDHRSDRFRVWPDQNRYWCRRCNAHGWLDDLVSADRPRITLPEPPRIRRAAAVTANPAHIGYYRQIYAAVALWAHTNLLADHNPEPLAYLHARGLSDHTVGAALLGYTLHDPESLPNYLRREHPELFPYAEGSGVLIRSNGQLLAHHNLRGALLFPYLAVGEVADLRTRTFPGKGYRSLPGSYAERGATVPFGWDSIGDTDTLIITEGEIKALAVTQAYQAGMLSAPALAHPGLSYWRPEWGEQLRAHGITTIYLAYDSQPRPVKDDRPELAPEEIYTIRHGMRLADEGFTVRVLRLPLAGEQDKSDLDAFLLAHGPAALERLLAATSSLTDYHAGLPRRLLTAARLSTGMDYPTHRPRPQPLDTPTAPAAPASDDLTAIRTVIPNLVAAHTAEGQGALVLAHPPGVGKGHGTTEGLRHYLQTSTTPGQIVWTALRNDQLHDQQGLNLIPLHGRNESNCRKLGEAQALAARGYPIREALCMRRCPFVGNCAYLRQFGQEADFFAPQPLLQALGWWNEAGVVVLDEFDPAQLVQTVTLDSRDIAAMSRISGDLHSQTILRWLCSLLADSGDRILRGATLLAELDQLATGEGLRFADVLQGAINALPPIEDLALLKGLPNNAGLAEYRMLPPGYLHTLLNQLDRENRLLFSGRTFTSRLELSGGTLLLLLRREWLIEQLDRPEQPKIILDATVTPELLTTLLPRTPIQIEQPNITVPCRVRQHIRADWAKSTVRGERREQWYNEVAGAIRPDRPTLVVCTKELVDNLRVALSVRGHTNVTVAHYGGLRGSNAYKGYDVILAQVYHPNLDAILREGRALFAGIGAPLDERIVLEPRELVTTSGQAWTVQVPTFADRRLAMLLERHREAEMGQCALRGRPLDHPDAQITLLFSLPLPGLRPTDIDDPTPGPGSNSRRQAETTLRIIAGAQTLLAAGATRIDAARLAEAAQASVVTVRNHWQTIAEALELLPDSETIIQPGKRPYTRAVLCVPHTEEDALPSEQSTDQADNKDSLMGVIRAPSDLFSGNAVYSEANSHTHLAQPANVAIRNAVPIVAEQGRQFIAGGLIAQPVAHALDNVAFGERGAQSVHTAPLDAEFIAGVANGVLELSPECGTIQPEPMPAGGDCVDGLPHGGATGAIGAEIDGSLPPTLCIAPTYADVAGGAVQVGLAEVGDLVVAQAGGEDEPGHLTECGAVPMGALDVGDDLLGLLGAVSAAGGALAQFLFFVAGAATRSPPVVLRPGCKEGALSQRVGRPNLSGFAVRAPCTISSRGIDHRSLGGVCKRFRRFQPP
jgi:hypothetical protein